METLFRVRYRLGEGTVVQPMVLPLERIVMEFNPDAVWDEMGEIVIWNHHRKSKSRP